MTDLTDLIARVEKLEGPDREVDEIVGRHFGWRTYHEPHMGECWVRPEGGTAMNMAAFTASLDAALALVERVLPGWRPTLKNVGATRGHEWNASLQHWRDVHYAWGPTPALAVILALLRALTAQDPAHV